MITYTIKISLVLKISLIVLRKVQNVTSLLL